MGLSQGEVEEGAKAHDGSLETFRDPIYRDVGDGRSGGNDKGSIRQ